jgi:hypothetical protein
MEPPYVCAINSSELKIYFLSSDKEDMGTKVSDTCLADVAGQTSQSCPGKYVAAVYDKDWYIGYIITHNDEESDILVKFMERKGFDILTFSWPQREDKCHIPFVRVLCTIIVWPFAFTNSVSTYVIFIFDDVVRTV